MAVADVVAALVVVAIGGGHIRVVVIIAVAVGSKLLN